MTERIMTQSTLYGSSLSCIMQYCS